MRKAAAAAAETGAALARRTADAVATATPPLLSSPDIVRQGPLRRWVNAGGGGWAAAHAVLTAAGWLYLLPPRGGESGADNDTAAADAAAAANTTPKPPRRPADAFNLCRCDLEAGDAVTLVLSEAGTATLLPGLARGRSVRVRAASVDDGCEWGAALRDAVAAARRRVRRR